MKQAKVVCSEVVPGIKRGNDHCLGGAWMTDATTGEFRSELDCDIQRIVDKDKFVQETSKLFRIIATVKCESYGR